MHQIFKAIFVCYTNFQCIFSLTQRKSTEFIETDTLITLKIFIITILFKFIYLLFHLLTNYKIFFSLNDF